MEITGAAVAAERGAERHQLRFLGIVIANGLSSEVIVMSRLLSVSGSLDATVFVQRSGDTASKIGEMSGADVHEYDFGWTGWRPPEQSSLLQRARRASSQIWALARVAPRVIRDARRLRPDVVYSSQQKWDCLLGHLVAVAVRRPHVVHLHYIPGPWLGWHATHRLSTCRQVIGVSDFIRSRAIAAGVDPQHASYVLNAAPSTSPAEYAVAHDADVRIGFVGRIVADKGQSESVMAFARLTPDVRQRCRLIFVGTGSHQAAVEKLAADLGIAERVDFLGQRADVASLLAGFDIFLHPSFEDPCPLAVLEAQAAGLPVVAFDEGGIHEIVDNGTTGLLVPDRDVDGLARAIERLVSDATERRAMGVAGQVRMAERFDLPTAALKFEGILRRVAPQR